MDFPKIYSFKEIIDLINENVLVVLDIDETILTISGANDLAKHTDEDGLHKLINCIENCNSKLIFLTARHHESDHYTKNDLKELNISDKYPIYYCALLDKGDCLKYILSTDSKLNKSNIIFIDDLYENLYSVKYSLGTQANCFRFILNKNLRSY
jgi:hypothetical protein